MGGRGSSSSIGGGGGGSALFQINNQPVQIQPTQQMAQNANNAVFSDTDSRPFHDLKGGRAYFQSQNLTIDQQIATVNYLASTAEYGSLYSMSQNMNYALAKGQKLNANQQFVYNNMLSSMHNTGQNLNLTRYDHPDMVNNILKQKGINGNMDNMSISQLKKALVGTKYGEEKLISTSTNDFKNAPQQSKNTFTTRQVKISYKTKANVQSMMPGDGSVRINGKWVKNPLGEMVLAPSNGKKNFKIVDVKYSGSMARKKGASSNSIPNIKQIELVVEVDKQG